MTEIDPTLRIKPGKTLIFVDGSNTRLAAQALGYVIDWSALAKWAQESCNLVRIYFYTTSKLVENHPTGMDVKVKKLLDRLVNAGYEVTIRGVPGSEVRTNRLRENDGFQNRDTDITVHLASDAVWFCCTVPNIDQVVLFSGDGNFSPMLERIKDMGIYTVIVSTAKQQPSVDEKLRAVADRFIELDNLVRNINGVYREIN